MPGTWTVTAQGTMDGSAGSPPAASATETGVTATRVGRLALPSVLAALVARMRRLGSRFGALIVAAGFAGFVTALSWATAPLPNMMGEALDLVAPVLFLHVFLAYPGSRLSRRLDRVLVASAYAIAIGLALVRMLLGDFDDRSLLAVATRPHAAEVVRVAQLSLLALIAAAGLIALAVRWRGATPALRRVLAPVIAPGALALLLIALLFAALVARGPHVQLLQRLTFVVIGVAPLAFLCGLMRSRLAVGPFVRDLGKSSAPGEVRAAVARVLRDPSLQIAYWLPAEEQYVDRAGQAIALPDDDRRSTPVEHDGRRVALLLHDAALREERELLGAVAAAAGLALENERLQSEVRASVVQVASSRARLVQASDRARRRLERNLHDGAQQRLLELAVTLRLLESRVQDDPESRELMLTGKEQLAQSLEELRELAQGLHPAVLTDHGLAVALAAVAARTPVPVTLDVVGERLPESVEVAAYYLICEALANVAKHAHAATATVSVAREGEVATVEVVDDGSGGADTSRGAGLRGLADRVEAVSGQLTIDSPRGGGTRVHAEFPCA
jgi:signal transduction histidine kinase